MLLEGDLHQLHTPDDISDWLELRLATPAAQAALTQQVRVLFALDDRANCTLIMALGHIFQSVVRPSLRLLRTLLVLPVGAVRHRPRHPGESP